MTSALSLKAISLLVVDFRGSSVYDATFFVQNTNICDGKDNTKANTATGLTDYENCRIQEFSTLSTKRFKSADFKNNVHFLKQSKVGGTTVSSVLHNIILKYGALLIPQEVISVTARTKNMKPSQKNLEALIGRQRLPLYKQPNRRLFYSQHCNIWDYSRRASPTAEKLLNNTDTAFLTIVRHPIEQYISRMHFEGHTSKVIHDRIMALQQSCPYLNSFGCGEFVDIEPCKNVNDTSCVNGKHSVFNETRALNYLNQFDLVLVKEQISESIIIMLDMLGFPVEEMGTVKLKAVTTKFHKYTETELEILNKHHQSRIEFYNLALQTLEARKSMLGKNYITKSVATLEEANSRRARDCGYQFVPENAITKQPQSRFKMNITDMLSNPLKLADCLPLLDSPRNNIESYIISSLEDAHRHAIKHALNSSVNSTDNSSKQYPYNLLKFYEKFKERSTAHLTHQHLFF